MGTGTGIVSGWGGWRGVGWLLRVFFGHKMWEKNSPVLKKGPKQARTGWTGWFDSCLMGIMAAPWTQHRRQGKQLGRCELVVVSRADSSAGFFFNRLSVQHGVRMLRILNFKCRGRQWWTEQHSAPGQKAWSQDQSAAVWACWARGLVEITSCHLYGELFWPEVCVGFTDWQVRTN